MLQVQQLHFGFHPPEMLLQNLNFKVQKGEIFSVLGESGSGKSSLLRLIYGLEDASSGQILFENQEVTGPKYNLIPGHPDMKLVPQEFDLLDYVTVSENVGKYLSNFDLPMKRETIEKALEVVKLLAYKNEFPPQLSGGQRQRVAIARAIAARPNLLLLDEPYSHLDQPLKMEVRKNIGNWAKRNNCTVILTTHDANDALGFSDKIIILKEGIILQNATPENLRNHPVNEYVAGLLGEYSILNSEEMKSLFHIEIPEDKRAIIYPEELELNRNGKEFQVNAIRFQGRDYLAEANHKGTILKFYLNAEMKEKKVKLLLHNWRLI